MDAKVSFALANRDISSFMISVGTGLMLETFFEPVSNRVDDSRIAPKANINDYKIHYFNIETLLRNILHSVQNAESRKAILKSSRAYESLYNTLLNELEIIKNVYISTTCVPIIYVPDYSVLYKKIENSIKPEDLNENKLATKELFDKTIKLFLNSSYKVLETYKIKTDLPSSSDNVLITTHIPYDLLNVERIKRLILVESHTGVLKDKSMFNTKYHKLGSKYDRTIFPFQRQLLEILGDGVVIKPYKIGFRLKLAEKAIENKWTSFTSEDRVRTTIKNLKKELGLI